MEPTAFAKLAAMAETDVSATPDAAPFSGRTAWTRNLQTPLRAFLTTETGSAAILLAAVVAALVWTNVDPGSYERLWSTTLSIHVGSYSISQDLQAWINSGLMAFFFFVIGLEARREFDLGELRERRRVALPLLAGIGGMAVPVLIYLAINAGHDSIHGWGTAMSTDTAFALGLLALVGSGLPDRLRAYLLTVAVVDDIVALLVIAVVYSGSISVGPLLVAFGLFGCTLLVRAADIHVGLVYFVLGTAVWVAFYESGVDPVVAGLMGGVIALAYPAQRSDLERASDIFRLFREQPTGDLARNARGALRTAVSPNERLQSLWHPWTSYVIVPLFALANAGVHLSAGFLSTAFTSPVTLGIIFGYVLGKPIGDEHAARTMSDRELGFRLHQYHLGRDPARPEYWDLTGSHRNRVTEIRARQIRNPDCPGIAKMNRSPVSLRVPRRDDYSLNCLGRCERTHCNDQRPPKRPCWCARQVRPKHGNVAALLKVTNRKPRALQRGLEAERAPKQECDEVLSPHVRDIRWLLRQRAPPIYTIARNIGTDIASGSHMTWVPGSGLGHIQNGAGLGITLAETKEIKREIFRQNDQVRLKVIRR